LSRSDLYIADEIFVCGTASEVNMVASVDDRSVGYPGPIGTAAKAAFQKAARGEDPRYDAWVEVA
jgi:branched-chain amino acid aminotransferase